MADIRALCDLIEGRVQHWHGLTPFAFTDVPSCLGSCRTQGWLQFGQGHAEYRLFSPETIGSEVWLISFGDQQVQLIEICSLPKSVKLDLLLEKLGEPDLKLDLPLANQLQRFARLPDEELFESVFAQRGLALLGGNVANSPARLVRIRGFALMPAEEYRKRFMNLSSVRFFPD